MAKAGVTYRHFKGGLYKVLHIARCSEDKGKRIVVYESMGDDGYIWTRPEEEFDGFKDDNTVRFELIKE